MRLACLYRFPLQFDALMVRCTFGTVFKAGAKSGSPSEASDPQLGARTFEIYVPLEHSYMPPAQKNAERWLDQSGALARKALDMAIARLPDVLDSGLATVPVPPGTPVRNVKRVGHYSGDAIKQDSTGSLVSLGGTIWSYEFSHGVDR